AVRCAAARTPEAEAAKAHAHERSRPTRNEEPRAGGPASREVVRSEWERPHFGGTDRGQGGRDTRCGLGPLAAQEWGSGVRDPARGGVAELQLVHRGPGEPRPHGAGRGL